MRIVNLKKVLFVLVVVVIAAPVGLYAQVYDYHKEEAPSISWNGVAMFDARMLGTGGISLMASPVFASVINPALIPGDDKIRIGVTGNAMKFQAYQYWGINEGVITSSIPLSKRKNQLSGMNISIPLKGIRIAAGWRIPNRLELPPFNYEGQFWSYSGEFPGVENAFFGAVSLKLGKKVNIGVKLEYVNGKRDVELIQSEYYDSNTLTITQQEKHRMSQWIPTIGAAFNISLSWKVAAALIYPLKGKADRTLDRVFHSGSTNIEISDLKSNDTLYQPVRIYLGTTLGLIPNSGNPGKNNLTLGAEVVYILWSDYKYEFYSEFLTRNMRNTLVLALGMEYKFLQPRGDYFIRAGFRIDPQPLKDPGVTLNGISGGFGTRWGHFTIDFGGIYYSGTVNGIKQKHWVINSTMQYILGGNK